MEIVRRWKIQKRNNVWVVFSRPTDLPVTDTTWRFLNYYPTFEEARALVDGMVTYYVHLVIEMQARRKR